MARRCESGFLVQLLWARHKHRLHDGGVVPSPKGQLSATYGIQCPSQSTAQLLSEQARPR